MRSHVKRVESFVVVRLLIGAVLRFLEGALV